MEGEIEAFRERRKPGRARSLIGRKTSFSHPRRTGCELVSPTPPSSWLCSPGGVAGRSSHSCISWRGGNAVHFRQRTNGVSWRSALTGSCIRVSELWENYYTLSMYLSLGLFFSRFNWRLFGSKSLLPARLLSTTSHTQKLLRSQLIVWRNRSENRLQNRRGGIKFLMGSVHENTIIIII